MCASFVSGQYVPTTQRVSRFSLAFLCQHVSMQVGILHPGAMGSAVASVLGATSLWASEGRSTETRRRAADASMRDTATLQNLVEEADVLISICPPAAALGMAEEVARRGFEGIYVDANAIAPATAAEIGKEFPRFVDAGIVGPPPRREGDTRLYLSGADSAAIADLFAGSILESRVVGSEAGAASALKMAYAAWTKGSTALLLSVVALAEANGLREQLESEWDISIEGLNDRVGRTLSRIGAKAWRFEGEMSEIVSAYGAAGLPEGFHRAAAEIYHALGPLKHEPDSAGRVLELLLDGEGRN